MNRLTYKAKRFCAVIVGFVFFVAGIFKLMDPVGTSLIVKEYMNFLHIGFMRVIATPVAEVLSLLETFLGICMITGVFRKVTAWAVSILLSCFTVLTLILWIFNPSMDCGCFGEAIHLTHFQSFLKNIVLCLLVLAAYFPYKEFGRPRKIKYVSFALSGVSVIAFAIYSLMYIPLLELTPFNLSSRLEAAGEVPDIDENDYISTFIYEKNGKQGTFTLNNLPDSTWTFVETKTLKKDNSVIEDSFPALSFTDAEGQYRDTLAAKGLVMVVSVPRPDAMTLQKWHNAAILLDNATENGYTPLLLVADTPEGIIEKISSAGLGQEEMMRILTSVYYSDYKTLISLNRSNGGAVYFNDGNLIDKWSARSLPSERKLGRLVQYDSTEVMLSADGKGRLGFQAFMLYSVALLLLV